MPIDKDISIFDNLDLTEYKNNLYSVSILFTDNLLEYYRKQAEVVNADYFYCFSDTIESKPVPFIYIYDQRYATDKKTIDLVEVNRQLWTMGEIALAVIIYSDGFKIIDTRNPIVNEKQPYYLDGLTHTIKYIDNKLKKRIFEGYILEESPADYISVSPYQKLLNHIEVQILNRHTAIGCELTLLKKILVKFILIKYLEEQLDEFGNSVFEKNFFDTYIFSSTKSNVEKNNFCDVLRGNDIIGLLNFLNDKFKGGIFNLSEKELDNLKKADFNIIADALDGNKELNGQMSIWRYYDFNLLPIEFISRLYERFVVAIDDKQKSTGAFYTPPHLARLLINELLPFDKDLDFNTFKLLDPSCGSGIFLVLAYKRLITLWMIKNKKSSIRGERDITAIKSILSNCIFGVDINEDALSITATSLQIELSSHIKPKEIWENLTFDSLESLGNLTKQGFAKWYKINNNKFDIIAGNPPFNISKSEMLNNVKKNIDDDFTKETFFDYNNKKQSFPDSNPSIIFLHKSLEKLLKPEGVIYMIMPAATFLHTTKSFEYRKSLMARWNLERVYDFTPLREHLWGKTKVATVAVKLNNSSHNKQKTVEHIIIRNSSANEKGAIRFQVDKYDKFRIPYSLIFTKKNIWKLNLLGGGRLHSFVEKFNNYPSIEDYLKHHNFTANIGYTRDNDVIDNPKHRTAGKVVNLAGKKNLDSTAFSSDSIAEAITVIEKEDWVRIPKNGFYPPNILIRLNVNVNLPIVLNTSDIMIPNGVLNLKSENLDVMKNFVQIFRANRELYIFLIKILSPKTYIQQGGAYSINRQDILRLPLIFDQNNNLKSFKILDDFDKILIEDSELIADSLYKSDSIIYSKIDQEIVTSYAKIFCEILNFTYQQEDFKFRTVRQIINESYIWVTFEHSDKDKSIQNNLTTATGLLFNQILQDNASDNALIINNVIVYFGFNNQISFIKPNKLKYWMRSIAFRDAENVKSEMFKNGY